MAPKSRISQQEKSYRERYSQSTGFASTHSFVHEDDLRTDVPKRLIVCCDGTWFAADKGADNLPSNVARIGRLVATEGLGITKVQNQQSKIVKVPQIVYYQSGVGTGNLTWVDKRVQGAFGASLDENVCTAYNFLCNNYAPGDELFFFGFSRGAYTARALAGLVASAGILPPGSMHYFYEMYTAYKEKGAKEFKDTAWWNDPEGRGKTGLHLKNITIKFVGVWDTVGALGVPESMLSQATGWNKGYQFHDTELHRRIEKAAHALALDEYRGTFSPTLWFEKVGKRYGWGSNLIQCWFPGYHAHVGGGTVSGTDDETSIDDIALAWMVDQVGDALTWDEVEIDKWVGEQTPGTRQVKQGKKVVDVVKPAWGEGNLQDSASYAFLVPGAGGWKTRTPGQYDYTGIEKEDSGKDDPDDIPDGSSGFQPQLPSPNGVKSPAQTGFQPQEGFTPAAPQVLPAGVNKSAKKWYPTHEYIHPVVRYRMKKMESKKPTNLGYTPGWISNSDVKSYEPASLKGFKVLKEDKTDHFVYWKKEDKKNGDVVVREYQVPPPGSWFPCIGLERRIIPPEILAELDKDNRYDQAGSYVQQTGFQPNVTWYNNDDKSKDPFVPDNHGF
ncbi:hypothetical protein TWF694_004592 [Orbilia ellipsospora]|uniref:T6SS Phospholipase effector Tle1-like catalytic domain-containing protein n=1 Tax=Orbilia ellipsospora TaxID=2528407 RepID=A0AAV9WVM0_9PEZI